MYLIPIKQSKYDLLFLLIMLAIASYFRFVGLGTWGFSSSDEYYMVKTGQNILKYGLPQFETGGFYMRGVLYNYLSSILLIVGVKDVLSFRIVSVLFYIASVPALYLLVKKNADTKTVLSVIFFFLFSTLEIEYSRIARFYTAFQAFFLWYLYFLYRVIIEKDYYLEKWLFLFSFLGIFIYEGAIFITVLNFLVLIYNYNKTKTSDFVLSVTILILAVILLRIDFRNLGVIDHLPPDINFNRLSDGSIVKIPYILAFTFKNNLVWLVPFFVPVIISIVSTYLALRKKEFHIYFKYVLILLLIFSLMNQFGLVICVFLMSILTPFFEKKYINSKELIQFLGSILIIFIYWFLYSYFTTDWFRYFNELNQFSFKKVIWILFNYPDLYQQFLMPWFKPFPIQTLLTYIIIFILLLLMYLTGWDKEEFRGHKFLFLTLMLMIIGVALIETPYYSARYSFFIYPILLTFVPLSLMYVIKKLIQNTNLQIITFLILIISFLSLSEDFNFDHIYNINSKRIHFKEDYGRELAGLYYYREDYKSPAEVINKKRQNNEIVISLLAPMEYYLDNLDYYYRNYKDEEFTGRSRERGKKEIWTNSKLIFKEEDLLQKLTHRDKTIWLITYSDKRNYSSELDKKLNFKYNNYLFYVNINNTINVFKLPQNSNNEH
jgi:hypothetical protein